MGSSARAQMEKLKKHKRKIAEITDAEDTPSADLAEEPVNASRGKRKKINGTHSRKEPSPITGDSDSDDVNLPSNAQKKRSRKSQTAAREIPSGT